MNAENRAHTARIKVLYIAGSGRSGSTLLERILGQFPALASIGELRHLWLLKPDQGVLCGCGAPVKECAFWNAVLSEASVELSDASFERFRQQRFRVDRIRFLPQILFPRLGKPAFRADLADYRRTLLAIYRAIQSRTGCAYIIDSSKDISTLYLLHSMPEIDLTILHMVRDSRGVTYSWNKRSKLRPEYTQGEVYMKSRGYLEMAWDWFYRQLMIHALPRRRHSYLRVRYEDFVQDPRRTLGELEKLLDTPLDASQILQDGAAMLTTPNHTVSGNPIRFQNGLMRIQLDEEWKQGMPLYHKILVTFTTLPFLLNYGYFRKKTHE